MFNRYMYCTSEFNSGGIVESDGECSVETSIFEHELYEIYEVYHSISTGITGYNITVSGKNAHADAIAVDLESTCRMTTALINGRLVKVTDVQNSGADVIVTLDTEFYTSDTIQLFLPCSTGTLDCNSTTGKFPLVQMQNMQAYGATGNIISRPTCGSKMKQLITFTPDGTITLGLDHYGSEALKGFSAAMDAGVYLLIRVKDTSGGTTGDCIEYDLLRQVQVTGVGKSAQAVKTERGIVTDSVTFGYEPPTRFMRGR